MKCHGSQIKKSGAHKPPGPTAGKGKAVDGSKYNSKSSKQPVPTTTVLFVEQTKGGELAKRLREAEERLARLTGWKVRIVEKSGRSMKQMLVKSNPWAGGMCERSECHPCKSGNEKQSCFKRNILYESICLSCKQNDITKVYVGESSRSGFERGGEHARDYAKPTDDSHMHKHAVTEHGDEEKPKFQFNIIRTFQSALTRQISEAVRIRRRGEGVLNSKGVYNRCALPRLVIEQPQPTPASQQESSPDIQEHPASGWETTTSKWRKKRRQIEDEQGECQGGARRCKRQRLCTEKQWGEQVPEEATRRSLFLMGGNEKPKRSQTLKQLKIRTISEGEMICLQIMNSVVERSNNCIELGVEKENQHLNMCYNIFEGG